MNAHARHVRDQVSDEEWRARQDLALAYRVLQKAGIDDLTYNHLSVRVPGEPDALLVKPPDFLFEEVTASSLLKCGLDGAPRLGTDTPLRGGALIIHAFILAARPQINVVFHTHSIANVAVGNQRHGLLPISQHALLFVGRIGYHAFEGLEFNPGMDLALLRDLGDHKVALLRNHGALVTAETVAEAVVVHHFLELACQMQIASLAGGSDLVVPDPAVQAKAVAQYDEIAAMKNGGKNWDALKRQADRLYPDYRM